MAKKKAANNVAESHTDIANAKELKDFLVSIRDRMTEGVAAPINALSAMNHVLSLPEIYDFLDKDNKEVARDIWLRIKQSGVQLKNPPLLFSADEEVAVG